MWPRLFQALRYSGVTDSDEQKNIYPINGIYSRKGAKIAKKFKYLKE